MFNTRQVREKTDSIPRITLDVYEQMIALRKNNVFTELTCSEYSGCDGRRVNMHRSHCMGCQKQPIDDDLIEKT